MELFYSQDMDGRAARLDKDESAHCVRVLRHRAGDEISIIDGLGTLYRCRLTKADPRAAEAEIIERIPGFGALPYHLTMAVCPTKNMERFEWFVEKATEFGLDTIVPVIGDRSERKALKPERLQRILLSAAKQSLKAAVPVLADSVSVKDFLTSDAVTSCLRLICCCFEPEGGRKSIAEALETAPAHAPVIVLIGPEGDFSDEELRIAIAGGWIPVSLGPSRLRTETAALAAVAAVYFANI